MKLLDWASKFSRRGFLAGGAATIAAVAVTGQAVLADAKAIPAARPQPQGLEPEQTRVLLKFVRDLFPHDQVPDSFYATAIAPLEDEAAKDSSARKLLADGVGRLNRLAMASGVTSYADVPDEKARVAIIKQIEDGAFFAKVYGTTLVTLYNQPEVWPLFGYEGPSSDKGGYLQRGFNDIDWL
jgi:hypothetical protein